MNDNVNFFDDIQVENNEIKSTVDVFDDTRIEINDRSQSEEIDDIESNSFMNGGNDEEPISGANKVLFDAEEIDSTVEENKEILFDAEEEIKKKEFENRGVSPEEAEKLIEENPELNPDNFDPRTYKIDENQKNVFDNGLEGGKFIPRHRCPMCMFGKKSITELYAKKRFSFKKRVVGYMSVCANCGHVEFYTNQPIDFLKYLSGKIKY